MKTNSLLNELTFVQLLALMDACWHTQSAAWDRLADLLVTREEWSRGDRERATDEQVEAEAVKHRAAERNSAAVLLRLQTEFTTEWSEFATEWWNEDHLRRLLDSSDCVAQ
jgi:hypothetical protein